MSKLPTPQFADYELIDSGEYEKLERFGSYFVRRPEPQAVWRKTKSEAFWASRTQAYFKKEKGRNSLEGNDRGEWIRKNEMPDRWQIRYRYKNMNIAFRLGLTAFKHVGIFPEQASNWNYIYDKLNGFSSPDKPVLNLFAYTGGASLVACSAGADVTHVEAVRQVVSWAKENMENSGLTDIRWVVEDALKYMRREVKRGKKYAGIILDPPAYGRGPNGEKWVLEENIAELMALCAELLRPQEAFVVLNLYSMGFSPTVAENLLKDYFPDATEIACGELSLPEQSSDKRLPLSVFARMSR